jgi:transcriptional regulator with XRE-family HTH domain
MGYKRAHLAPVPQEEEPPTIAEQLHDALAAADVSQRQLAQRLAGKNATENQIETKRRRIQKILTGKIARPRMDDIASALNLPPDHFRLPTPAQVKRRLDRQEAISATVERLEDTLDDVLERLEALERRVAQAPRRESGDG